MQSNSVCNHTRDKQIGLPLRGRPILLITRVITDRIGLHSVLLPLYIYIYICIHFFFIDTCEHSFFHLSVYLSFLLPTSLLNKFFLSAPKEMYREQYGEYTS